MLDKVAKIFSLCIFLILFGCARTPIALDVDEINASVIEDREALSVDASLQNIDLHSAIAVAIKNNRDLRISVMESALAQRQNNLQRFDMLPDIALDAGYSEFTELQPSTSVGVELDTGDAPPLPPVAFPPPAPFPPRLPTFIVSLLPPFGNENLPILPCPPLPPFDPASFPPIPPAPPTTRMVTLSASSGIIKV